VASYTQKWLICLQSHIPILTGHRTAYCIQYLTVTVSISSHRLSNSLIRLVIIVMCKLVQMQCLASIRMQLLPSYTSALLTIWSLLHIVLVALASLGCHSQHLTALTGNENASNCSNSPETVAGNNQCKQQITCELFVSWVNYCRPTLYGVRLWAMCLKFPK